MDDNLLLHGYERTGSWVKDFVLDFVFSIKALSKMPKCDMLVLNSIWSPILCLLFKWKYRRAFYIMWHDFEETDGGVFLL